MPLTVHAAARSKSAINFAVRANMDRLIVLLQLRIAYAMEYVQEGGYLLRKRCYT
jgi:hypothetical protein